jgi:hypothetical protein
VSLPCSLPPSPLYPPKSSLQRFGEREGRGYKKIVASRIWEGCGRGGSKRSERASGGREREGRELVLKGKGKGKGACKRRERPSSEGNGKGRGSELGKERKGKGEGKGSSGREIRSNPVSSPIGSKEGKGKRNRKREHASGESYLATNGKGKGGKPGRDSPRCCGTTARSWRSRTHA